MKKQYDRDLDKESMWDAAPRNTKESVALINATQHPLNEEQVKVIEEILLVGGGIYQLKDIYSRWSELANSPKGEVFLEELAYDLIDKLSRWKASRPKIRAVYIHLPIGSPAFMWQLSQVGLPAGFAPVFSHTERIVEEKDGEKRTKFKFQGFVEMHRKHIDEPPE